MSIDLEINKDEKNRKIDEMNEKNEGDFDKLIFGTQMST